MDDLIGYLVGVAIKSSQYALTIICDTRNGRYPRSWRVPSIH